MGVSSPKKLMDKICLFVVVFLTASLFGCSKKNHPTSTAATSVPTTKTAKKSSRITTVPKVIAVNDKVAKRSVDGRYYYDLGGRRYWRNNKDGKYYLFNKSMFDNEDFKAKGN